MPWMGYFSFVIRLEARIFLSLETKNGKKINEIEKLRSIAIYTCDYLYALSQMKLHHFNMVL